MDDQSEKQKRLLRFFNELNKDGQEEAILYVEFLTTMPKNQKNVVDMKRYRRARGDNAE